MAGLILGLCIALMGALVLAGGSELQSRAVHTAHGEWRAFIKSPSWILGLILLGTAVATNFIALALAPIAAVQSMSVVALAASALFGVATRQIAVTPRVRLAIAACLVGALGFIAVVATHPSRVSHPDLDRQLMVVLIIQAALAAACLIVAILDHGDGDRWTRLGGLVVAAMEFSAITAVFKVLVGLVLRDGLMEVLTRPASIVALGMISLGGLAAGTRLQSAHTVLPAPAVVAGLTITDTITAAALGTVVLREHTLTETAVVLILLFGSIAIGGVVGLKDLQRTPNDPNAIYEHRHSLCNDPR